MEGFNQHYTILGPMHFIVSIRSQREAIIKNLEYLQSNDILEKGTRNRRWKLMIMEIAQINFSYIIYLVI